MVQRGLIKLCLGLCSCLLILGVGITWPAARAIPPPSPPPGVGGLPALPSLPPPLTPLKANQAAPVDFAGGAPLASQGEPRQVVTLADPTNYGDRFPTDADGRPVQNEFIAVLHETVGSAQSALNLFLTAHPRDQDQVSYHTLIGRDGTIYYIVPPEKRAFGAGNSVFDGPNGPETVRTNPAFPPSVNNFAYHVSLETPGDGANQRRSHSGYTQAQYNSLAWLMAQTTIPDGRITTHQAVDRSGSRRDPRSFDRQRFFSLLRRYPTRAELVG